MALILGGGIYPQLNILSRHRAAVDILERRQSSAARVDELSASNQK